MLKWFTNLFGRQVAIDSRHVVEVYETDDGSSKATCVVTTSGVVQIKDSVLEVVSRLNAE